MDISLHSFIFVVGLVVISFIVWDGIKRVRESRANRLDEDFEFRPDDAASLARSTGMGNYEELEITDDLLPPSVRDESYGEAFPSDTDDEPPMVGIHADVEDKIAPSLNDSVLKAHQEKVAAPIAEEKKEANFVYERPAESPKPVTKDKVKPPAPTITEQESVPVLMEPVELGEQMESNPPQQHELILPEYIQQTLQEKPITSIEDDIEVDPLFAQSPSSPPEEVVSAEAVGELLSQRPPAEEIIVINVLKESEPLLNGADLYNVFKACDMRHGEMSAFHRFEKAHAQGKIQFSVVNTLKPGIFDIHDMESLQTPGISLFMSLPGPENPMEAFDAMSEMAQVFARNFNASVYDESHSDLTPQTLEHYRHRIREYSRKYIPANA
jgi:cell division protein ZipA